MVHIAGTTYLYIVNHLLTVHYLAKNTFIKSVHIRAITNSARK